MNYDEAREVKEGGWHWTTMNDGVVRTAKPCITIKRTVVIEGDGEGFDPGDLFAAPRPEDVKRCEPHATKEEAERHFYDWCLSELKEHEWETARKCEAGCGEWTNKSLGGPTLGSYFPDTFLCDFHRLSADWVEELHPFKAGIQLVHS